MSLNAVGCRAAGGSSTQRKMVIVGREESCMHARRLVHDALKVNTGKRDYSQHVERGAREGGGLLRLTIPRHLVGRVIVTDHVGQGV